MDYPVSCSISYMPRVNLTPTLSKLERETWREQLARITNGTLAAKPQRGERFVAAGAARGNGMICF